MVNAHLQSAAAANTKSASPSVVLSVAEKLAKIRQNVDELNAETDALNTTIEKVEKVLLGAGVPFWWKAGPQLCLNPYLDERHIPARTFYILGYAKVGKEWCIAVRELEGSLETAMHDDDWDDVELDAVPLRAAARCVRVAAAPHLEEFLDALNDAIVAMNSQVKSARERITV